MTKLGTISMRQKKNYHIYILPDLSVLSVRSLAILKLGKVRFGQYFILIFC